MLKAVNPTVINGIKIYKVKTQVRIISKQKLYKKHILIFYHKKIFVFQLKRQAKIKDFKKKRKKKKK